ncbi:hypothetical protein BC829DRAFT_402884, partial [Chytridium lagenaria]
MFLIPFVTIAISEPPATIPISGLAGLLLGLLVGLAIYQTGSYLSSQDGARKTTPRFTFSFGLVVRAVRGFEVDWWVRKIGGADDPDALDTYYVPSALWHFNCCNPNIPGPWALLKSLIGWDNTGTIASVGAYCAFWIGLSVFLVVKKERMRRLRK